LLVLPVGVLWYVVAQPVFASRERSKAAADPDTLRRHVVTFSQDFYPRSFRDAVNMARCANYIEAHFRQTGAVVTSQPYLAYKTPCRNVIALFPGQDPRRVVIGAHYDAVPGTPGADDNASGVAGLLELARLLQGAKLRHTVELVAYCTEEPPCFASEHMGSSHHARRLAGQRIPVKAMIALEMIGFFSDAPGSQSFPVPALRLFYGSRGNFIGVVGGLDQRPLIGAVKRRMKGATGLPVRSIAAPSFLPGVDYSDHQSYWEHGIPAVMVTDTAFYRNRQYHSANDTADRLDCKRMADVVVGVYEAVVALANEE
jgi:Zn-dependent M28 family amino/carboxypeptidase